MRRALSFLLCALLLLPICGCNALPEHALPVLMYHSVVPDGQPAGEQDDLAVTESRFREDMRWLADHGYSFVLPRELAAGEIPEKPVMVTFDDGYRDNYEILFPILQELDVKAAVALIVSRVDGGDDAYLSWDMCREMSDSGLVEFGSHSYALHNLDERGGVYVKGTRNGLQRLEGETSNEYADRVWGDLYKSIHTTQDQLGAEVRYFSYPFGVQEMWSDGFIQSHFDVTVTTEHGVADLDAGYISMKRLAVAMDGPVSAYLKD